MTLRIAIPVLLLVVAAMPARSHATTITFENAAGAANEDIPTTYGSNIAGNATGFITTDETGATPDIALNWSPTPNFWEYHTSGVWQNLGTPVHVAQLDNRVAGPGVIAFTVGSGVALTLHSFDIGNATDQFEAAYRWSIDLKRASDSVVVASQTTSLLSAGTTEAVTFNFTGAAGEDYRLEFTASTSGLIRTAIDNLSFSQAVPEPSMFAMLGLGVAALGAGRLRRLRR